MAEINTFNTYLVGAQGDKIVIMNPPTRMTPDAALVFAAYLVSMAEVQASHAFVEVLAAVRNG